MTDHLPDLGVFDQVGCARCDGDGHEQLLFHEFIRPVVVERPITFTGWALCPTTGEPILMAVEKVEQ